MRKAILALVAIMTPAWPVSTAATAHAPAAAAQRGVDDPHAFVEQGYAAYRRCDFVRDSDIRYAFSDRLRGLFDGYADWQSRHSDTVGSMAFDWWMNSQDWQIGEVHLADGQDGPDQMTISAQFQNLERQVVNNFMFVRQNGRWYLDDVINGDGGGEGLEGWTLSALLSERPEE